MNVQMLKSKLHQARVTDADVDYEGSLGIDVELMEAVGLHPYEKVLVANVENAQRFETYAIAEPFGSRAIVLRGAAARLGKIGDRLIIMSFCWIEESLVRDGKHRPRALTLDAHNDPVRLHRPHEVNEIASMLAE